MSLAAEPARAYETPPKDVPNEAEFPYRSLSRTAVLSLVLGLLSSLVLGFVSLTVLPVVGLVLGISAWRSILRYPTELTGLPAAKAGTILSAIFLVCGVSWHTYDYLTEVPEGYTRISFSELQPNLENPGEVIPKEALALNGQKIFLKGYVHPGVAGDKNVKQFVLVNDYGTCCFGGQPKPTHMVEIFIEPGGKGITYNTRTRKVMGTFAVGRPRSSKSLENVIYAMKADDVK